MPMPFYDEEFTFTQPDGTKIRVRGTGDQDSAVFETLDGYTIVRDDRSGYFHYAKLNDDAGELLPLAPRVGIDVRPSGLASKLRPKTASRSAAGNLPQTAWQTRIAARKAAIVASGVAPQRSVTGSYVGLCLLVDFPGAPNEDPVPGTIAQHEVDRFCNERGYTGFQNKGSVRDYFEAVSDRKLDYTNIVTPWYTAKKPRSYYANDNVADQDHHLARELVEEALTHLVSSGFDAGALTTDSDHYVVAVNVFYAGTRTNSWSRSLWPHQGTLRHRLQLGPNKIARDYQMTDMTDELSLGTFCHENGHLIGDFPDLYDKTPFKSKGIGEFCLMCSGDKKPHQKSPLQIGAYLKYQAGWTSALHTMTPGTTISLRAGRNEFAIWRNSKSPTEYLIVENRQNAGQDAGIPSSGLAVWHVDERVQGNNDEQMTATNHFECSLLQADGKYDLEHGRNSDAQDLYRAGEISDTSAPHCKWWDGSNSGLHIRGIRQDGDTTTFTVVPAAKRSRFRAWLARWSGMRRGSPAPK